MADFAVPVIEDATLKQGRAKVGLFGPSGCGKTLTMLFTLDAWAETLGEDTFVVIDSENKTSSKYVGSPITGTDRTLKFKTITITPPYSPDHYIAAIKTAERAGYKVCGIDSITHEWTGEGGAQEIADTAGARMGGNRWAGWSVATPAHNKFVEAVLRSNMHILATMRAKTEWIQENGKPKKIGLGPVQRENLEYEFDIVLQQHPDHSIDIEKSRALSIPEVHVKPGAQHARDLAVAIMKWLQEGEPADEPAADADPPDDAPIEEAKADPKIKQATKTQIKKLMDELQEKHPDYDGLLVRGDDGDVLTNDDGEELKITWVERMVERMEQWYSVTKSADLTEPQGKEMIGKLQDTIVTLDRKKAGSLA